MRCAHCQFDDSQESQPGLSPMTERLGHQQSRAVVPVHEGIAREVFAKTVILAARVAARTAALSTRLETRPGGACFEKEGDFWTIAFEGKTLRLKDAKGLGYLARLLRNPGCELHVLDLAAPLSCDLGGGGAAAQTKKADRGDAGEILDSRARAEYRRRLAELREDLDESRANNDIGRAAKLEVEIGFLAAELAAAVGLGGRDRKAASNAERARASVTSRIKSALRRIASEHPSLGHHLAGTIRTGTFCSYAPHPERPIAWRF